MEHFEQRPTIHMAPSCLGIPKLQERFFNESLILMIAIGLENPHYFMPKTARGHSLKKIENALFALFFRSIQQLLLVFE